MTTTTAAPSTAAPRLKQRYRDEVVPAYRRPEPPSTRMHSSSFAPVLSATRSRDSCWIIGYLAFSRMRTTRQRFVADSGLVSMSSTRSPTPQSLRSSCALTFLVRRIVLP